MFRRGPIVELLRMPVLGYLQSRGRLPISFCICRCLSRCSGAIRKVDVRLSIGLQILGVLWDLRCRALFRLVTALEP